MIVNCFRLSVGWVVNSESVSKGWCTVKVT